MLGLSLRATISAVLRDQPIEHPNIWSGLIERVSELSSALALELSVPYLRLTIMEYRGLVIMRQEQDKFQEEQTKRSQAEAEARQRSAQQGVRF